MRSIAPEWGVAPVLKSNAYGHGLALVAEVLQYEEGIPFFCIDSYFEAGILRRAGFSTPLLILGATSTSTIASNRYRSVAFTIASISQLQECVQKKIKQSFHLKFDTGMHRRGILAEDVRKVIELLANNKKCSIEGVLSHLADAETIGSQKTEKQIQRWNEIVQSFQKNFPSIRYYHLANSAGFAYAKKISANVGRAGLALYGINPGNLAVELSPALRMISTIQDVREIESGETVGYNDTYTATRRSKIGVVPAGYFEGVDRRLSNKGSFLVHENLTPIVGRVSMNMSSCDITDNLAAGIGSPVCIVSDCPQDPNSVEHIAQLCDTIPYEVLVRIPAHLYRVII
jgi:alanine racemase